MTQEQPTNVRCFSRKDAETLEKLLEKARQGTKILKVTRLGATLYVTMEPTFEEVWQEVKMEKVDTNG